MATGEVRVLRPFKLIALLCLLVALALDVVALLSPAWVTSQRGSLSLWEACKRAPDVWHCLSTLRTAATQPGKMGKGVGGKCVHLFLFKEGGCTVKDWQVATLVLILTAATITFLSFLASLVSFCLGTPRRYYRVVAVLLLVAVVLQVCALILYPIKFIDSSMLKSYHEFNWGYGLGWGSVIFMLGAAILYCLRTDIYEDAYY
ncbi:transmembrane protein 47-like isoform X1 [Natator depressus]|uniref:transmembrane protein 47-like isoform X1 n=1 Tax=Natator depressus TaxID=27790 RepID=UPI003EBA9A99